MTKMIAEIKIMSYMHNKPSKLKMKNFNFIISDKINCDKKSIPGIKMWSAVQIVQLKDSKRIQ